MSLLKKVNQLNNFEDENKFFHLICCDDKVGMVHEKIANIILKSRLPYFLKNKNLILKEKEKKLLNKTLENTCELLYKHKILNEVTGEMFPCSLSLGKKEYFFLDRALVEYLGIRGYGVHLIAYVKENSKIKLWIPLRAKNKRVEPNKLDNTVAGGIASGETVRQALIRESSEEASFNRNLLKKVVQTGTINYNWRNKKFSLRRDTLFLFDLEISKDTIPKNKDGELQNFKLIPDKKVINKIQNTTEFKKNCALVLANFFIRRGLINFKNERNYEEICRML